MTVRLVTPTGRRPQTAKVVNSAVASIANGKVVKFDGDALVGALSDTPGGIMCDAVPTDNPPRFYRLAVSGDVIFDTALTSVAEGTLIWQQADGTYSTTKPTAGAADSLRWILGKVQSSDANGSYIELHFMANTDAVT